MMDLYFCRDFKRLANRGAAFFLVLVVVVVTGLTSKGALARDMDPILMSFAAQQLASHLKHDHVTMIGEMRDVSADGRGVIIPVIEGGRSDKESKAFRQMLANSLAKTGIAVIEAGDDEAFYALVAKQVETAFENQGADEFSEDMRHANFAISAGFDLKDRVLFQELLITLEVLDLRDRSRPATPQLHIMFPTRPGWAALLFTAMILIILPLVSGGKKRAFYRALDDHRHHARPEQGLALIKKHNRKSRETRQAWASFEEMQSNARKYLNMAQTALAAKDYDRAGVEAQKALEQDSQLQEARDLYERIDRLRQAVTLMEKARQMSSNDPRGAIDLFYQAGNLDPDIAAAARAEAAICESQLSGNFSNKAGDRGGSHVAAPQMNALSDAQSAYALISRLDQSIAAIDGLEGKEGQLVRLRNDRERLQTNLAFGGDAVLDGGAMRWRLLSGNRDMVIGRASSSARGDFLLSHKRVSRPPKQGLFRRAAGGFDFRDGGSSNGAFIGDEHILPGKNGFVAGGDIGSLALGGTVSPPEKGRCRLKLHAGCGGQGSGASLAIYVDPHLDKVVAVDTMASEWPNLEADRRNGAALVGDAIWFSHHGLPVSESGAAFGLLRINGQWHLQPVTGVTTTVEGQKILYAVSLAATTAFSVDGRDYVLHAI